MRDESLAGKSPIVPYSNAEEEITAQTLGLMLEISRAYNIAFTPGTITEDVIDLFINNEGLMHAIRTMVRSLESLFPADASNTLRCTMLIRLTPLWQHNTTSVKRGAGSE